ncbi:unnamed protein product [Leuciscus chuanchicus]
MSKRRWVEFKICQTISCSAPRDLQCQALAACARTVTSPRRESRVFTWRNMAATVSVTANPQ